MENHHTSLIEEIVSETHFQDTHEHLPPETKRIEEKSLGKLDFSYLFSHYLDSDLLSAGMPVADFERFFSSTVDIEEKWRLLSPFYKYTSSTGYGKCLSKSLKILWNLDGINHSNYERLNRLLVNQVQPGFYREIIRGKTRIDQVQINAMETVFGSDVYRDDPTDSELFRHDFCTLKIATQWDLSVLSGLLGTEIKSLYDCHEAISNAFNRYGKKAVSIKDPCAYWRDLDFFSVTDEEASQIISQYLVNKSSVSAQQYNAVGNNLFRHALRESQQYNLPVKIHTGFVAGSNHMNLKRVKSNLEHLCSIISDFPEINFVLMHITYPFQNELLAMAKHFTNVYVDMCWSWIIDPISATEFLSKFLVTAPNNKIFTFGGDFIPVELIPGHAQMAREGIVRSVYQLLQGNFISHREVEVIIPRIMHENASNFFSL